MFVYIYNPVFREGNIQKKFLIQIILLAILITIVYRFFFCTTAVFMFFWRKEIVPFFLFYFAPYFHNYQMHVHLFFRDLNSWLTKYKFTKLFSFWDSLLLGAEGWAWSPDMPRDGNSRSKWEGGPLITCRAPC